jgi:hypothetical protein
MRQRYIEKDPAAVITGRNHPDLFGGDTPVLMSGIATCIECGCTDEAPCCMSGCLCGDESGTWCDWIWVDRESGQGLCSECDDGGC